MLSARRTALVQLVGMVVGRAARLVVVGGLVASACTSETAQTTTTTTTTSQPDGGVQTTTTGPTTTTAAPIVLPEVTPPPGYELVWRDEFLEPELDRTKWNIEHSTFGDGGNTLHCYTPNNVSLADGVLRLTGLQQSTTCPNGSTRQYSSGMVHSADLATFRYGWFEVRARVPEGQGFWPAIWMSPQGDTYGRWPASGEIDLMEVRGDRTRVARVNAHYLGPLNQRAQDPHDVVAAAGNGFADTFHTYGLLWEPGRMVFMIDGIEQHRFENWTSAVGPNDAPFDQQFFFRLNLAIGGNYPGSPDQSTPWPGNFDVDWVRVFQPIS